MNHRPHRPFALLDRFHDIFLKLHHISSIDDKLEPFPIRTTCIAFHEDIRSARNFPEQIDEQRFMRKQRSRTRVNLPAISKAREISFARRRYFVHLQLINRSAVSND